MLLKIYPTINLENGYLVAGSKYRGSSKKAYKNMIDKFFSRFELDRETIRLVKVHGLEKKDIIEIETILKEQGVTKTEWVDAGAVISCHGGPGAVGLAGIENK